jgi:hypothetical protein
VLSVLTSLAWCFRTSRTTALCIVLGALVAPIAHSQMLGAPVLQNAFSNPGITVGLNYGTAEGIRSYGLAGAWAPSTGRFQVSAGIGGFDPDLANDPATLGDEGKRWPTYGGRVAVPLTRFTGNGSFGVAPFAGIGTASRDGATLLHVPAGVAAGYRRGLGETRAISAYLAPFYSWNRFSQGDVSESTGVFRVSGGVDVAVTQAIGLTVGYEAGSNAEVGDPGPSSAIFGIGLSYAFRR